jgi:hypothetical protein
MLGTHLVQEHQHLLLTRGLERDLRRRLTNRRHDQKRDAHKEADDDLPHTKKIDPHQPPPNPRKPPASLLTFEEHPRDPQRFRGMTGS